MFTGNALWVLVAQSDLVSKLVLLSLLGMSILCWSIFFYKIILLRLKRKQMADALAQVKMVHRLEDLLTVTQKLEGTLPGYFLSRVLASLKSILETKQSGHDNQQHEMHEGTWEYMQYAIDQTLDDMMQHEESYLPVLSTCAAVGPLLGLFGTVWGLVHSFVRISQQQSADIVTVAPGIAEALITTLAGLIVAIPALMMFNYVAVQVRQLEQQFSSLADKVSFVVQRLTRL